jgi:hypothetical protein
MIRATLALFFLALPLVAAEHRLLYVTMPGTYYGGGTPGILIFDINAEHKFVRRLTTPDFGGQRRAFAEAPRPGRLYVSSTRKLWCFDLKPEKVLWDRACEKGCRKNKSGL